MVPVPRLLRFPLTGIYHECPLIDKEHSHNSARNSLLSPYCPYWNFYNIQITDKILNIGPLR
jgi:hypothetical protein